MAMAGPLKVEWDRGDEVKSRVFVGDDLGVSDARREEKPVEGDVQDRDIPRDRLGWVGEGSGQVSGRV